jgi:hypothetical protein
MGRPSHLATKYDEPFRLIAFLLSSSLVYSKRYISCLRSMLTLRVPSWILEALGLLWRRHFLLVFLGAVALYTQIRFCKLTLQAVDEEQSRLLMRKFLIRHFFVLFNLPILTQPFHHGGLRHHAKLALDEIGIGRDPIMGVPGAIPCSCKWGRP